MFGTFQEEKEPVTYGLVSNVNTFNPVKITFMAWSAILQDIKRADNFTSIFYSAFGPPSTHTKK
jgi:hypothetical protein